jgi:hypothetical protein
MCPMTDSIIRHNDKITDTAKCLVIGGPMHEYHSHSVPRYKFRINSGQNIDEGPFVISRS